MKFIILAAVAGFGLATGTAFAGEGAGDPFPFRAPGVVTTTAGRAILRSANTDPYPFRANGTAITTTMSEQIMPTNGAEGTVQTANSLPLGFANGTVAFTQQASVERYRAARFASRVNAARLAQHQAAAMPNKG